MHDHDYTERKLLLFTTIKHRIITISIVFVCVLYVYLTFTLFVVFLLLNISKLEWPLYILYISVYRNQEG